MCRDRFAFPLSGVDSRNVGWDPQRTCRPLPVKNAQGKWSDFLPWWSGQIMVGPLFTVSGAVLAASRANGERREPLALIALYSE